MKTSPCYLAAFLLSVPGLGVYFLNPNRSASLFGGLLLQLIGVFLVFYLTIPQEIALDKFKRIARDDSQENRKWLITVATIYLVCSAIILIGINSGFLRFTLFLIMWGAAIAAGEMIGILVWHHFNKEWLAEELKREAAEVEKLEKEKEIAEARKLKEEQKKVQQRAAEREEAIAAAKEKAAQAAAAKRICKKCGNKKTIAECICPKCGYTDTPIGTWKCVVAGYTSTIVLEEDGRFIWSVAGLPASQGYQPGHFTMELEDALKPDSLKIFVHYDSGRRATFYVKTLKEDEMRWENPGPPIGRFHLTRIKRNLSPL